MSGAESNNDNPSKLPSGGTLPWTNSKILEHVSFETALRNSKYDEMHVAHCMLWSKLVKPLSGLDKDKKRLLHPNAAILVHLRFCGHIGFPGGIVDDSVIGLSLEEAQKTVVEGLNRELVEELNFDNGKHQVTFGNYVFTQHSIREISGKNMYCHFFAYELPLEDLEALEQKSLSSREHGREVMGNFRVPLFTMADGYRGLPSFLNNNFIGNSRAQMLTCLVSLNIMTQQEVDEALAASALGKK